MATLRGLAVFLAVAWLATGRPAPAQQGGAGRLVDRGVQAYLEGDYEKARTLLEQALSTRMEMARLLGAMQYLGFALVALGEEEQASLVFYRLLDLSPHLALPAGTPPKIGRVFEEVAGKWRAAHPPPVIHHQPAAEAKAGVSQAVTARVEHLRDNEQVLLLYRDGADSSTNQKEMKRQPDGTLEAVLPAPLADAPLERSYQIEVRAADGALMARAPKDGAFRVSFPPPAGSGAREEEKPHRTTWWIWAVAGAVVAGAAVGLGVGLSGHGSEGGRAIVHIQVNE